MDRLFSNTGRSLGDSGSKDESGVGSRGRRSIKPQDEQVDQKEERKSVMVKEEAERAAPKGGRRAMQGGWGTTTEKLQTIRASLASPPSSPSSANAPLFRAAEATQRMMAADTHDTEAHEDDGGAGDGGGRRRGARDAGGEEEGDEIMVIPDLDDEGKDVDMVAESAVAAAPKNIVQRLKSIRELDNDNKHVIVSAAAGGMDLSLLTQRLIPADMCIEEDEVWEFDTLLEELTQEWNAEMEKYAPAAAAQAKDAASSFTSDAANTATNGDGSGIGLGGVMSGSSMGGGGMGMGGIGGGGMAMGGRRSSSSSTSSMAPPQRDSGGSGGYYGGNAGLLGTGYRPSKLANLVTEGK